MIARLGVVLTFLLGLFVYGANGGGHLVVKGAQAQVACGMNAPKLVFTGCAGLSGFSPSCTSSSNWLARATTVTINTDKTNYDNLLCTLDTNGVGCAAADDILYILAAPNATAALLNLCSASYPLSVHGTETFSAFHGYTGGGAGTDFLSTPFVPSTNAVFYSLNSASLFTYLSGVPSASVLAELGGFSGIDASQVIPSGDFSQVNANAGNFTSITTKGLLIYSRTTSSLVTQYLNGGSNSTNTSVSTGLPAVAIYVGARNNSGTADLNSTDQLGAAGLMSGLNSTQAANFSTAVQTYMTVVGN